LIDLYIIVGGVLLIVLSVFGIPWLEKKGLISKLNFNRAIKSVNLGQLILDILPVTDAHKNKINSYLHIASEVIDYVNTYANETFTKDDKRSLALKILDRILKEYGVKPSISEMKLIEIIIDQSLDYAEQI
jgi:hypothetical protein